MKGKMFRLKSNSPQLREKYGASDLVVKVEGEDVEVFGQSWKMKTMAICYHYGFRVAKEGLPLGGKVFYVKIVDLSNPDGLSIGELVHENELGEEVVI